MRNQLNKPNNFYGDIFPTLHRWNNGSIGYCDVINAMFGAVTYFYEKSDYDDSYYCIMVMDTLSGPLIIEGHNVSREEFLFSTK